MTFRTLDLEKTGQFDRLFLDYLGQKPDLADFYGHFPDSVRVFDAQTRRRFFSAEQRKILVEALRAQYADVADPPQAQIERLLNDNTFTVTTGHQLNIFSGPLYFIHKIVSTIKLAADLCAAYPDRHFVPIYWMATEDHDLAEINHFNLFGKRYEWQTPQSGATGRMSTEGIAKIWTEIAEMPDFFKQAYAQPTLAAATRSYVHSLFGKHGLLVLDADRSALKTAFSNIAADELLHGRANKLVGKQSERLREMGYKTQISVREINLFFLEKENRTRIVRTKEGSYAVLNTEMRFSEAEILAALAQSPESFSPNVALRPLYQECILPNVAYVGGPAEIAYWLQLKTLFDHYKIPFPLLLPRSFVLIINKLNAKRLQKLSVPAEKLFLPEEALKRWFVEKKTDTDISLHSQMHALAELFAEIGTKAKQTDPSLQGFVQAQKQKSLKNLQDIEKRLKKSEEKKHQTEINQLLNTKNKLFPNNIPQERTDNVLNFLLNQDDFVEKLLEINRPFSFKMNILSAELSPQY